MVFIGQPNLYVRISNKYVQRMTNKKGFYFDEKGLYSTENELLIKLLKQNFEIKEIKNENNVIDDKQDEIKTVEKMHKCKHCDFTTTNKGDLLAHYREHKKMEVK